jgi:hypothetical protein
VRPARDSARPIPVAGRRPTKAPGSGVSSACTITRRRWDLSQNTPDGESVSPTDTPDADLPGTPGGPPDPGDRSEPSAPPAGLFEQVGRTVTAARRLVTTHVDLARAELSEIADRAKVAAALIGVAIALALFAAILVPVGTALFIGEWLFGSIGWGVLHGVLSCVALIVVLVLGALEMPPRRLATSLLGALALGIVVAVVLGLAWPNQAFARVGDAVIPGVDPGVRTLVAGLALGALVIGILGFLVGARAGGAGGAVGGLFGGAVVGVLIGAFLSISFSLRVGIALGICVTFIAWPALAAMALRSFDGAVLKARYWPGTTIETTKETIEWVRARTPLGRKP